LTDEKIYVKKQYIICSFIINKDQKGGLEMKKILPLITAAALSLSQLLHQYPLQLRILTIFSTAPLRKAQKSGRAAVLRL
jgi:hypothetical protein